MDEPLTDLLATDLDAAFPRLVSAHQHRLYAAALALVGCRHDAEEVASDAFIRAHRALRRYSPERVRELRVGPWLHRIAVNAARNRLRGRRPPLVSLDETASLAADARDQPDTVAERRADAIQLREHLSALPLAQREAVVLRHVQGMSYADAAATLEQPIGTVKANVHRGLQRLRASLESANGVARNRPQRRPGADEET